jgi:hypothetical protein
MWIRDVQLTVLEVNLLYLSVNPKVYSIMALLIVFRSRLYFSYTCIVMGHAVG